MASTINASNSGSGGLISAGDASGVLALQTAGTTAITVDASQNVGIGTASPSYKLNIIDAKTISTTTGDGQIAIDNSTSGQVSAILFSSQGSRRAQISSGIGAAALDGFLSVTTRNDSTGFAERMRVNQNGSVYVGNSNYTISPSSANYGFGIEANGGSPFINHSQTPTSLQTYYAFINGNGTVGTIKCTGSSTQFNTSSDVRLKKNVVDAPSAIASIQQIGIKSFDWKADDLHQEYGVIAQELDAVAPEAVSHGATEDEMWGVDYSKLVPRMIKAIQELKAINDTQAEELSRQAATINALVTRIEALENK